MGGFLADIFVEAEARRGGVGRALVAAVTGWLSSCGVGYFEWYVAANNIAGQEFWRAVGGRGVMLRMRANLVSQNTAE
jgi:GNAT superfamily N-acetyltransferase